LSWTRRAAELETDSALTLVGRLPLVFQALLAGRIDRPKALVFVRHLAGMTPEQIEVLCRIVLPRAEDWTTGQISSRLLDLIIRMDPEYHERRYRKAVRDRQVVGFLDQDGTATVTGSGLPAEAPAALERVDTLARAARRAGHPATLDQLGADFLGLLDGSLHGMTGSRSSPPCSPPPPTPRQMPIPIDPIDPRAAAAATGPTALDPRNPDSTTLDPAASRAWMNRTADPMPRDRMTTARTATDRTSTDRRTDRERI
jgi:hypothetical protein